MKPHQEQSHERAAGRRSRTNASISVEPLEGRALLSMGMMPTPMMNPTPVMTPMRHDPNADGPDEYADNADDDADDADECADDAGDVFSTTTEMVHPGSSGTMSVSLRGNLSSILRPKMSTTTVMPNFPHMHLVSATPARIITPTSRLASPAPAPAMAPTRPPASQVHHQVVALSKHEASASAGHNAHHQHESPKVVTFSGTASVAELGN